MNSTLIQHWQFGYVCVALLVAVVATVITDHLRSGNPPALAIRCGTAGLVGIMWPLAMLGALQFSVIAMLAHRLSPAPAPLGVPVAEPEHRVLAAAGSR